MPKNDSTAPQIVASTRDKHADLTQDNKRIFVKDMAQYLVPPNGGKAAVAESAGPSAEPGNPTVLPIDTLRKFQWTFLIRHPRRSIPSYYRCTVPPLDEMTGFYNFMPSEAGYEELRCLFDFLIKERIVDESQLMVIDADDLLDDPESVIRAYCDHVGLDFTDNMLNWGRRTPRSPRKSLRNGPVSTRTPSAALP